MSNSNISYEIIFIDDKSPSDNTAEVIKKICESNPKQLRYVLHEKNQGRGAAVMSGIYTAKGSIIGYIDPDLETPAYYIPQLTNEIKKGYDIVTGLRIYSDSPLMFHRTITSYGYRKLAKLLIGMKFKDSESGCKFFNKEKILKVLPLTKAKHWFWDTEIMMESYFQNLSIKEIPTLFTRKVNEKGSTVLIFRDTKDYFKQLIEYRKRLKERNLIE